MEMRQNSKRKAQPEKKPKKNCQRTFTACWTCRRRNVRCDEGLPCCSQCMRMKIECEGYDIRLVWVDSETGHYVPQQRRAYPCERTWSGYPSLSLKEVGHLIDECEDRTCECALHSGTSVFSVFPQGKAERTTLREDKGAVILPPPTPPSQSATPDLNVVDLELNCLTDFTDANHSSYGSCSSPTHQELLTSIVDGHFPIGDKPMHGQYDEVIRSNNSLTEMFRKRRTQNQPITGLPWHSPTLSGNLHEDRLFHHYVTYVSLVMMPIDDGRNPWKSTYPSIAIQATSSYSARSLYHAILAKSAFNLANLKGPRRGASDKAHGMQYLGLALSELRRGLVTPAENYSSMLAALLTVTIAQDVYYGKTGGWRHHFKGAMGYVIQYLDRQPWRLSRDAWVITQNFALSHVIAQTVGKCSPDKEDEFSNTNSDSITAVYGILSDVMKRPDFGHTIGGTARLIKSIYQIRQLEEQTSRHGDKGPEHIKGDKTMAIQVSNIIQQLQTPLDDEVEAYCNQLEPDNTDIMALPQTRLRMLARLHFQLFNNAAMIYLLRTALHCRPSAVAEYVAEVLSDAVSFIDLYGGSVAIWPVFVAAAEAYTPESQAMAERFLDCSGNLGVGNRGDIQRVIHRVWAEREELATAKGCDAGAIVVDWRDVMERLDLDILLL